MSEREPNVSICQRVAMDDDAAVLLAPTLAASVQGRDLEDVRLLRAEAANLAWAVERTTEGEDGRPADRA